MAVASVEIKYSRVLCFLCATFCYVFFVCFLFCMCLFESITGKVFPGKSAHVDSCDRYGVQILSKFVFIYLILSGKNSFQKSNYFLSYTKKTSTGVCSPHASLKRIIKKNTGRINEIIDLLIALFQQIFNYFGIVTRKNFLGRCSCSVANSEPQACEVREKGTNVLQTDKDFNFASTS